MASAGSSFDVVVVGAGPNGLAAAITLARAGKHVLLREAGSTVGASCRSAELTQPGFVHDICSTVQAMAQISPFMRSLPLAEQGVEFARPAAAFAHPLDDASAGIVEAGVDDTARSLGIDGPAYRELVGPFVENWKPLMDDALGPLRLPRHPLLMARFGLVGLRSATALAESHFRTEKARALFAGVAAHAVLPLEWSATSAFGLMLTIAAHAGGWPVVKGGSQILADAMADYFRKLGGEILLDAPVESLDELPAARAILCDLTPRQLIHIASAKLPRIYVDRLERYRYGPGVFKIDWALRGPIPWRAMECRRAGTVHVGGTLEQIADSERDATQGRISDRPYVLLVQASLCDPTRAPPAQHTGWAYCHVPNGCDIDMTERIENQIERFAPGFRDLILARHVMSPVDLERHNPNLIGGDIGGGSQRLSQLVTRPIMKLNPYATPVPGLYLCSSSTPPGGGVHGMCGYFAAHSALRREFK